MDKIEHEGKYYISQEKVEDIISERLKKYAHKSATYEEQITSLQTALDEATTGIQDVNLLREKINQLETNLNKANSKYERHTAINKHGITEPEVIEILEWQYEKTMKSRAKKDREKLDTWLEKMVNNPSSAPISIKPHLPKIESQPEEVEEVLNSEMEETSPPQIDLNSGALKTPPKKPIISQIGNLDYYRQNRKNIRNQFYQKRRNKK